MGQIDFTFSVLSGFDVAEAKADALVKTIAYFNRKQTDMDNIIDRYQAACLLEDKVIIRSVK